MASIFGRTDIYQSISVIGEQTIFADPVGYANLFVRCSQAPAARTATIGACRIPGGDPLAYIINTNQNLGITKTNGLDFQANWQGSATQYGTFNIGLRSTYVKNYDFQVVTSGAYFDAGRQLQPTVWWPGHSLSADHEVWLELQHVVSQLVQSLPERLPDQNAAGTVAPGFNQHKVEDHSTWDLSVTYSGIKGLTLRGGVINLFDSDPPYSNQSGRFQARSYDDRFWSPLGRVYTLAASYQFF